MAYSPEQIKRPVANENKNTCQKPASSVFTNNIPSNCILKVNSRSLTKKILIDFNLGFFIGASFFSPIMFFLGLNYG